MMPASVQDVADYVLSKVDPEAGDSITNLKLQKIVYYCQAWHLALTGKPLFQERIEAWAHGPAVPSLWRRFSSYGWQAIDPYNRRPFVEQRLPVQARNIIDEVWKRYGDLSGKELEALTHRENPWREAYGDTPPGGRCTREVPLELMREFYREVRRRARA